MNTDCISVVVVIIIIIIAFFLCTRSRQNESSLNMIRVKATKTSTEACPIKCLQTDASSKLENNCMKYQFPKMSKTNVNQSTSSSCPYVDLLDNEKVSVTVGVKERNDYGYVYYCADADINKTNDTTPQTCSDVRKAPIQNPCDTYWAELERVDEGFYYAQDWDSSCNNFSKKLVEQGAYKTVACLNHYGSLGSVEYGMYTQAWPSTGYDLDPVDWANKLGCQTSPSYYPELCEKSSQCESNIFDKNENGEIVFTKKNETINTVGQVFDSIKYYQGNSDF